MDRIRRGRIATGAVLLVLGALSGTGCGSSSNEATVTGKVTLNGKTVSGGTIKVISEDGAKTDSALIGKDGTFKLTKAPIGQVKVALDPPPEAEMQALPRGAPVPPEVKKMTAQEKAGLSLWKRLPGNYRDLQKTPLKITIKDGESNVPVDVRLGRG